MPSSRRGLYSLPKLPCILMFRQFFLISSLFIISAYPPPLTINTPPSKRIYRDLVVPTFPKTCSSPLVPYDISPLFPCSPKPPGHPQYVHIEKSHAFCIRRWTHHGAVESVCPSLLLFFVLFCFVFLSRVIMFNSIL